MRDSGHEKRIFSWPRMMEVVEKAKEWGISFHARLSSILYANDEAKKEVDWLHDTSFCTKLRSVG